MSLRVERVSTGRNSMDNQSGAVPGRLGCIPNFCQENLINALGSNVRS